MTTVFMFFLFGFLRMLQSTFSIIRESIHPEFDYKYWGPFLGLKMAKSAIKKTVSSTVS